jgi:hypothetical protein
MQEYYDTFLRYNYKNCVVVLFLVSFFIFSNNYQIILVEGAEILLQLYNEFRH